MRGYEKYENGMCTDKQACELSVPCRDPNAVKHTIHYSTTSGVSYARALTPIRNPC